ncbi:MAG: glycine cleavage system protein GcvH [Opitutales bacterium]|tara:strand:- start:380 stop:763 length:384 start_codon:yes stop_codon:yes gene_type:complete
MSDIPENLSYTKDHEWLKMDVGAGEALVGITDHAQESLGDITFVELPELGAHFSAGDVFGVVESVKAASDLYMPLSGEVLEVNPSLESSPELLNTSPYEQGWLVRVKLDDPQSTEGLLSAGDYANTV